METEIPDDWKKAIIVTMHKGKGSKDQCNIYRGISLLSVPGKLYGSLDGLDDRGVLREG